MPINNTNISPKAQHEKHAKLIMARRNTNTTNDTPAVTAPEPTPEPVVHDKPKTREELRLECDVQGIKYKKKDTIAVLIYKLEAE